MRTLESYLRSVCNLGAERRQLNFEFYIYMYAHIYTFSLKIKYDVH